MNNVFPLWVTNLSTLLSFVGFIITCFLFWEARKIRLSFMRKARIPEIVNDLNDISKELFEHLKSFDNERINALQKIQDAKGLLESIVTKMDNSHKKKINDFIDYSSKINTKELKSDSCWEAYTKLSGLVTYLKQIEKDTKWEQ